MGQVWCKTTTEVKQTQTKANPLSIEPLKTITNEPSVKPVMGYLNVLPLLETSPEFTKNLPFLNLYLPRVLHPIICDYSYWFIKEGSWVDVQGLTESFHFFYDPVICVGIIQKILNEDSLIIKPIHRFKTFAYMYPGLLEKDEYLEKTYSIASPHIQPFRSKVDRIEVNDLKDLDLVDVKDIKDGKWKAVEVIAKLPNLIWVQYGDLFTSEEHKHSLREWINLPSDEVTKYLTHTCLLKLK